MAFGQTKPKDDITKTQAPQQMGPTENKSVTTLRPGGPPAALANAMKEDAGKGVSTAAADNQVPLIYVLQSLSPQVDQRNAASYIEGAQAGDIWLRNASNPVVKGDEGFVFQPCAYWQDIGEWVPRDQGGGFIGRHPMPFGEDVKDAMKRLGAKSVEDPRNTLIVKYYTKEGNELVHTRSHAGFVITDDGALPYVLPFTSSGHSSSRSWMTLIGAHRYLGEIVPSWACLYRLKTVQKKNKKGTWFVITATNAGPRGDIEWVDDDAYARGKATYEAFKSGAKKAEAPVADVGGDTDSEVPF